MGEGERDWPRMGIGGGRRKRRCEQMHRHRKAQGMLGNWVIVIGPWIWSGSKRLTGKVSWGQVAESLEFQLR